MRPTLTLVPRLMSALLTCLLLAWGGAAFGQAAVESGQSGPQWKDRATQQQIVQQELAITNTELAKPNLTDWSTAMLEAYKSFLTFTEPKMKSAGDMGALLDQAYQWIKTETVQNAAMRQMVLDDMKAKQQELIYKLTWN
ncbi:MAG TPA: hypothetical protein PKD78_09120 [Saprospiraceae bacterium]|nr:hypothetical protein [Saprospiraceae bacterium]HNG89885.1 hypothetical protein [Saprospiraceae bacterium]